MTVLANARQTVPAPPPRTQRRFGIFSVVDVVDGGDQHWMFGGLTADGEECSTPLVGQITCGPSGPKSSRSWYSDIEGDPWLTFMYETCKTVGRISESAARLRQRFLAIEQSAVELGFQLNVLNNANLLSGGEPTIARAIAVIEAEALSEYGAQITLHMPAHAAQEAIREGLVQRFGNHLETVTGNLVSVGQYRLNLNGGTLDAPVIYGVGNTVLYRTNPVEVPPQMDLGTNENDYYVLIERAYAALVDCFMVSASGTLCGC